MSDAEMLLEVLCLIHGVDLTLEQHTELNELLALRPDVLPVVRFQLQARARAALRLVKP